MEREKLIQSILSNVEQELRIFLKEESEISCPVEYEKRLIKLGRKHSLDVLSVSRGRLGKSRNSKKKILTTLGKVEVAKSHPMCPSKNGFGISVHMQELMCYTGQGMVYSEAEQLLYKTLGVQVSGMQIQRICKHYGEKLDALIERNCESIIPKIESVKTDDPVYVMMDGSMIFTRDEQWKELKLGSVFYDSQVIDIQTKRREILDVVYASHLGSVNEFFPKFERHLVGYKNKVILGDGARWIWKWAEDNYPGATQILDYYHAKEKLLIFAQNHFKEDYKRKEWLDKSQEKLLNNEVEIVIEELSKMRSKPQSKIHKLKAIQYFKEHEDRMQYKTYKEKGLLIGSGPIEAAHRSVIQQRMKLSGQKWTTTGANAIATLRCFNKSKAWQKVATLIKAAS